MTETSLQHIPVLADQVLQALDPKPGQNFLDCTVGGGGHSHLILENTSPNGKVFAMDRDPYAISRAKEKLLPYGDRVEFFDGEYSRMKEILPENLFSDLNGALIDCGVSSFQLDSQERGFSFRFDSPLDMRMNSKSSLSAKSFLLQSDEEDLANAIYELGEERNSRKIAKNIVEFRRQSKMNTTFDLVEAVMKSFPPRHYWKTHPATKTFQAIRMKVNDELGEIQQGIQTLLEKLPVGSKIVVITFHSLEDRLVKHVFRNAARENKGTLPHKKPIAPSREEVAENPRSRSAKMRTIEIVS